MAALVATIGTAFKGITLAQGLSLGGTLLSGVSAAAAGKASADAANMEAAQYDARAKAEQAAAQRDALQERRKADLVISRARAVGAESGGGVDIPLMASIEEEGELNYQTALWDGDVRAASARDAAKMRRFDAKQQRKAGAIKGMATLLSGGSSFFENYG